MKYQTVRDLLFLLSTETSHHLSLESISLLRMLRLTPLIAREVVSDPVEVMGIVFPNRVGLAAGMDKDARCVDGMASMGFGFLEVGTLTPNPQSGNPKPRLFRLKSRKALINRMGFNNEGVVAAMIRIRRSDFRGVLGINIGKNATTAPASTLDDYLFCLRKVYKHASYVVINISSPNTRGLRSLQHGEELAVLLEGLKEEYLALKVKYDKHVPLVVKIAPDMEDDEVDQLVNRLLEFELDGVCVGNTTVSRANVTGEKHADETGGLSGDPLRTRSNRMLGFVAAAVDKKMAIIGVGGIMSGKDAVEKIRLGADLVQVYTGFIYAGPDLVAESALEISNYFSVER